MKHGDQVERLVFGPLLEQFCIQAVADQFERETGVNILSDLHALLCSLLSGTYVMFNVTELEINQKANLLSLFLIKKSVAYFWFLYTCF